MKKNVSLSIVTSILIALLTWLASIIFSFSYGEWSFFIGLGLCVILFFFNSSGGPLSKVANQHASESVWKVQKDNEMTTSVGPVFYGTVLYTTSGFIVMLILYF